MHDPTIGHCSVASANLSRARIHRSVLADLTLTRRAARRRLGAEEILVIEEENRLSVLPTVSETGRCPALRVLVGGSGCRRVELDRVGAVAGEECETTDQ